MWASRWLWWTPKSAKSTSYANSLNEYLENVTAFYCFLLCIEFKNENFTGCTRINRAANVLKKDHNFASLVKGIEQGRLLFDNMRKSVSYLLIQGNGCEVLAVLVNTYGCIPLPESAFLMIFIAFTSDVLGAVAMVFEPSESEVMHCNRAAQKCISLIGNFFIFTDSSCQSALHSIW